MIHLLDLTPEEFEKWFADHGFPGYRARQARGWVFKKRAAGFAEMTDLPLELRERLARSLQFSRGKSRRIKRRRTGRKNCF